MGSISMTALWVPAAAEPTLSTRSTEDRPGTSRSVEMARHEPDPRHATAAAILLAAGRSERMRAGGPGVPLERKPFLAIEGRTVLEHAGDAFRRARRVDAVVLVVHAEDLARARALASSSPALSKVAAVVEGGARRTDSVRRGLAAVPGDGGLVAVHDVARPLVEPELIGAVIGAAAARGAALAATPVTDTIKTSVDGRSAESTLDRTVLWAAQTPQVFRRGQLERLLEEAARDGFVPTDDGALYERYVGPIPMVEGDRWNLKLTTPDDLVVLAALLRERRTRPEPR
jgi:2-C-methyl-D-erythritol 4-phosphate cytidylyltransferase